MDWWYVFVALLLAPFLRRFGQYTIPDFLGTRYGGTSPRLIGIFIAILCSFTYVVGQIKGVGIITTRLTGVEFETGVFLGLAGILVCSFLGGMRAVTWTQVSQYIVLIIAYLIPVIWLSVVQTGNPIPQLSFGQQLGKISLLEEKIYQDPAEKEVMRLSREARETLTNTNDLDASGMSDEDVEDLKKIAKGATEPARPHATPFVGETTEEINNERKNFLALIFCLTLGTASLPHILMRYYTTPSVKEARTSVTWSLLFILLLYLTAPTLAVLVKYVIYSDVVGSSFSNLPPWVEKWMTVDSSLLSITDINKDGIIQLAEIYIHQDIVVLATPEIAGLPVVISGMVAAGGLAAALSTSDGLLLAMANGLSHDLYYKMIDPTASVNKRVKVSKTVLLIIALLAALVAQQNPADILFLIAAAFSFAASGFFPALILGIFWKRATRLGASAGMLTGVLVSFYYMATNQPWLREILFGIPKNAPMTEIWFGIDPISAGLFGVPAGFAVAILVSLFTKPPKKENIELLENIRYPELKEN